MNFLVIFLASLIPLIVGFIWYNPKTFGTIWMNETGMTPEKGKQANMAKVFGLTFLFSFMLAIIMQAVVIHQTHFASILSFQPDFNTAGSQSSELLKQLMDLYGTSYRTFKHGALHGTIAGLFIALPIMSINALFEQKSFKYVAVNASYWAICMGLMGGVLSAFC